ncbi:replication factor C subunit 4 isoform X2 [Stigmatopora argus]
MQAFLKSTTNQSSRPLKEKWASGSSTEKKDKPWVDKYRPKCVDEVTFQEEVIAVLKRSLQGADLPNLLFYGPPGTGKTSTIFAAAIELYGGKACPPFKIIILDEADSMTAPAQAALRRIIEKESRTTRFCLICNYISRIIEPLTSRCSKFRFKALAHNVQEERLLEICEKEKLKYTKESISALVKVSEGDLRKAITLLQSAARLIVDNEITELVVFEISGVVPTQMINDLLQVCFKGSFEQLEFAVQSMVDEGYAATQILSQLHDSIIEHNLSDKHKSVVTEKMAMMDKCLSDGADEYLQLLSLCSVFLPQAH